MSPFLCTWPLPLRLLAPASAVLERRTADGERCWAACGIGSRREGSNTKRLRCKPLTQILKCSTRLGVWAQRKSISGRDTLTNSVDRSHAEVETSSRCTVLFFSGWLILTLLGSKPKLPSGMGTERARRSAPALGPCSSRCW